MQPQEGESDQRAAVEALKRKQAEEAAVAAAIRAQEEAARRAQDEAYHREAEARRQIELAEQVRKLAEERAALEQARLELEAQKAEEARKAEEEEREKAERARSKQDTEKQWQANLERGQSFRKDDQDRARKLREEEAAELARREAEFREQQKQTEHIRRDSIAKKEKQAAEDAKKKARYDRLDRELEEPRAEAIQRRASSNAVVAEPSPPASKSSTLAKKPSVSKIEEDGDDFVFDDHESKITVLPKSSKSRDSPASKSTRLKHEILKHVVDAPAGVINAFANGRESSTEGEDPNVAELNRSLARAVIKLGSRVTALEDLVSVNRYMCTPCL